MSSWKVEKIAQTSTLSARGGSSVVEVNNKLYLFGGADREQKSYNDMYCMAADESEWRNITEEISGDVPMPRSGHAVTSYGKYIFLYGGIEYSEMIDFNDLYIFDTESLEWKYVGEKTEDDIIGRNSHSLCVLTDPESDSSYLILYGGASMEHGPLGDCLYAKLSPVDEINTDDVYVEWKKVEAKSPGNREMHSTCATKTQLIIVGGRDQNNLFDDVWKLSFSSGQLKWRKLTGLQLSNGRCSHGASIFNKSDGSQYLCIFGGFSTECGVSKQLHYADISDGDKGSCWKEAKLSISIAERFGLAMCTSVTRNSMILFGGINLEFDFSDTIMIVPN